MRHRQGKKKLGMKTAHRLATLRNLASALILNERIMTTRAKAKSARAFVEKLVTLARNDTLANRRRAFSILPNRIEIKTEDGKYRMVHVINKLFDEVAPRYKDRPGGYTRIIHYPKPRLGDAGDQVIFEFVHDEDKVEQKKPKKKSKGAKKTKTAKEEMITSANKEAGEEKPAKKKAKSKAKKEE